MEMRASAFEQADRQGVSNLKGMISNLSAAGPRIWGLPEAAGGNLDWWDTAAMFSIPVVGSWFRDTWRVVVDHLPDWLARSLGFKPPALTTTNVRDGISQEGSGFGKLLEKVAPDVQQTASIPAGSKQGEFAELQREYEIYHVVPVKVQGDLMGDYGCTPTSISMVLDYHHRQDSNNNTVSPTKLFNMRDPGDWSGKGGMSLSKLSDELNDLGYGNITEKVGASVADLTQNLTSGPVITTLGVGLAYEPRRLTGLGTNIHTVVVRGISENGSHVIINDPWSGKQLEYPMVDFEAMWSVGGKGLYAIRP
jgi:uncharacterized protein YvpB